MSADTNGDDILISWNRPDSVFLDAYHVAQRQQNTEDWDTTVVAADQTSHRHAGPTPGTTYEYRARSVNAGGVSEWTSTVTGVWYDTAAPPAQFIYTPIGTNRILVKWTPSLTPDIQRYQLRSQQWTAATGPRSTSRSGNPTTSPTGPRNRNSSNFRSGLPQGWPVRRLVAGLPGLRVHSGRRDVPQGQP